MDSYRYNSPGQIRFGPGPLTKGVKYLLIVCCSIYIFLLLTYQIDNRWPSLVYRYLGLAPYRFWHGCFWQIFTYLFFHQISEVWHLAFNMLILWMFGVTLERDWGTREFLKFLAVTGIGAGFVSALVLYGSGRPIIGFSGALFGIYAAYLILYPNREVLIFAVFPMRIRTVVYIIIALEILMVLSPGSDKTVAHLTHFAGLGIGYFYLKPGFYKRYSERYYRWRLRRLRKKRGFSVVQDDDDDRPTLH